MNNIITIAKNTFREAFRNKIIYSVVLFAAVLIAASAFLGSVSIGSQVNVIKDFGLFSLSFFGVVITIISGVTLLNKEIKQKTIFNILSKPVSRWQFILGKHLGLSLTVCSLVSLMGIGLVAFVSIFEGKLDLLMFQAVGFCLLEIIVVAAITIFFSSIVITTTLIGIFTLSTYLVGRSIEYLSYFVTKGNETNPGFAALVSCLDWILPDLSLFNISNTIVYGIPVTADQALSALLYCIAYSAIMITCASFVFEKRELV